VLLLSREAAKKHGLAEKSIVRDYVYAAADPLESLLEGPALTVPKLLERNGLSARDIGVWEIHEAFAAQVVACLKLLAQQNIDIPLEKINVWGGSLSLGHPFGATGGRLLTTATRRLAVSGARYAVVTGCAAGGEGSAILLENPAHKQ
jgi:acetyl-CoA acyltransferase